MAPGKGVLRHLEGWELALVAVTVALVGIFLLVPFPVTPEDLPLPVADDRALADRARADDELAAGVIPLLERDAAGLYDLRAFGEAFRAYGRAEASAGQANGQGSDMYEVVRMRRALIDAVNRARALGDDKMRAVRAYQKAQFIAQLENWERTQAVSEELTGLGGSFLTLASRYGWRTERKLDMSERLRGIFFERRWNELTGLTEGSYALSLDEHRAFYRFLLTHPPVEQSSASPKDVCLWADEWRLRKIAEIARIDPSYPAGLARGVLLYRTGRYPAAADAFRDYLGSSEDGAYALRARNYLAEANARAQATPSP